MSQDNHTQFETITDGPMPQFVARQALTVRTAVGAFLGMAWGAALRGWMVLLALNFGEQPQFTWQGTLGGILIPATVVGALLGRAKGSETKRWWVIFSPWLLVLGPAIFTKDFFTILFTTGMGGGAIGVAIIGTLGAYAFSGLGASWKRWAAGIVAGLFTFGASFGFFLADQEQPALPFIEKALGISLFILLMALLIAGVSLPFRRRSKPS